MVELETSPLEGESERAPPDVCEISIQARVEQEPERMEEMQEILENEVGVGVEVTGLDTGPGGGIEHIIISTGTDRLDLASLRQIAETYTRLQSQTQGNIDPSLTLVPTASIPPENRFFTWLQIKLQLERPTKEVQRALDKQLDKVNIVPKNPLGDNMEALIFRDKSVSNDSVKSVVDRGTRIRDALDVEQLTLMCEKK